MQLIFQNFKTHKVKNYCKKEDTIKKILARKTKRMRNKDNWVYYMSDDMNDAFCMYTSDGELLSKECMRTVIFAGYKCKEVLPYDYHINNNIKEADIVYCSFNDSYYIMTADENEPDVGNKLKFLGLEDYPEEYTTWGISQYFLSKVSREDINKLHLGYLYDMMHMYENEQFKDLGAFIENHRRKKR